MAGSEAAALAAERGAIAVVFEQGARPYGKIEHGLPRWHVKLRREEFGRIDDNLAQPNVLFVPCTRVGRDVSFRELVDDWRFSAVVLANGAWRDRPLPIPDADRFVDRGLVYQNPFVYWFNHHEEPGYDGPRYEVPGGAVVIGGGLASIDVVKMINLELYRRALRERGVEVDVVELEHTGIAEALEQHGLTQQELGVRGCTLYYRRRKQDMPLTPADAPTPAAREKLEQARVRIVERVERKYLVRVQELAVPVAPIVEGDRMRGLVFRRSERVDGCVREVEGSDFEVRTDLVVSSIGSIPEPIVGVPMTGELYRFGSRETGELEGLLGVYGLGNVLTGRGNIRQSRASAARVTGRVLDAFLGGSGEEAREEADERVIAAVHGAVQDGAGALVDRALRRRKLPVDRVAALLDRVQTRWKAVGYEGDYRAWIAGHGPPDRCVGG